MDIPIGESEAQFALASIERRRQQVLAEIAVPPWYWFFVAGGWIALGVMADYAPLWASTTATVLFGALHATAASRALSGRRGSTQLSIRPELVSHHIATSVIGFLVAMTAVTVGVALLLNVDGARHPAALASGAVAAVVLSGGPALMGWLRRRAERG